MAEAGLNGDGPEEEEEEEEKFKFSTAAARDPLRRHIGKGRKTLCGRLCCLLDVRNTRSEFLWPKIEGRGEGRKEGRGMRCEGRRAVPVYKGIRIPSRFFPPAPLSAFRASAQSRFQMKHEEDGRRKDHLFGNSFVQVSPYGIALSGS